MGSVSYLSFSSASGSHLSIDAYQAIKTKLVQTISKVVKISFADPEDISLEGRTLAVLEKSGDTLGIPLTEAQAQKVKKILNRSIGFVRNTGDFAYGSEERKDAVLSLIAPPDSFRYSLEKFLLGPLNKGLSFCQNALAAFSLQKGSGALVRSLGGVVGVIDLGAGVFEMHEAEKEMGEAEKLLDREGYQRAEAKLVQSEMQIAAGSVFIGESIWTVSAPHSAEMAALVCTPFFFILMAVGSAIGVAFSAFGIQRCRTFLRGLNEYLENPHLTDDQKAAGALRFLQEQLSLSPEEEAALPEGAGERREAVCELLKKKVRYVKRRTSLKSLLLIANTSEALLKQIANPAEREGGIKQALSLIEEIKWASHCKIALNALSLVGIIVGFAALVTAFILTGGGMPLFLALGAGGVCFGLSTYSWVSSRFFRLPEEEINPQLIK